MSGKLWRHFDFWLLGAVTLLIILGLAMIRSTTLNSIDPAIQQYPTRQLIFALVGMVVVFIISAIDYRLWGALSATIYWVLIGLLGLVWALAAAKFGAARWLDLKVIQFQPSELGKFLITLTLGNYVATHSEQVQKLGFVLRTLLHVGLPVVLIFLQPDLSTAVMYGVVWLTIMWAAGLRPRHIAILAGAAGTALPVGFLAALSVPKLQYMTDRLVVFLIPNPDSPEHQDALYNINQALISIGSGGWTGQGYGHGSQVQLHFLKVRHTDFIFSAISNELGFIGAVVVILLMAFVVFRIFRAGQLARDAYGRYVCYGVGIVIMYQAFFNIGMNMNLLPVSGIPLPFVSYGGSSLWTFLFGIGLVESVVLRQKKIEF
jgi:rod shape determining protein RodA